MAPLFAGRFPEAVKSARRMFDLDPVTPVWRANIERGMINYPFLSEHDWHLDNIRGETRFGQAMERARREWERLEV